MCVKLWKSFLLVFWGVLYDECAFDAPSSSLNYIPNMYMHDIIMLIVFN